MTGHTRSGSWLFLRLFPQAPFSFRSALFFPPGAARKSIPGFRTVVWPLPTGFPVSNPFVFTCLRRFHQSILALQDTGCASTGPQYTTTKCAPKGACTNPAARSLPAPCRISSMKQSLSSMSESSFITLPVGNGYFLSCQQ